MSMNQGVGCARAARVWSCVRWLVVAAALPLVWACTDRPVVPPDPHPSQSVRGDFPASSSRKLDILFMIDNSKSMTLLQNKLLDEFPTFMDRLKAIPTADGSGATALPDIHVAVVSSDTGGGRVGSTCRVGGDLGAFQFAARAPCTTSPLPATPAQQTFLSASKNQTVKNYDGDISDAFRCIAALGDGGCGFEGQLKAVRLALDPVNAPPGNEGFVRPDALLAVILITNEDDCSLPDDSDLMAIDESTLGPLTSFRCNEYGHLCNINGTMQPPPRGAAADLQGCVSNETSSGMLTRVADDVAFLKSLKSDPAQIFVAAIAGLPDRYDITMAPRSMTNPQLVPTIAHSCMQSSGEYGDPAVRIGQWVQSFGANGLFESICAASFAPALQLIGETLFKRLQPECIQGTIVDRDPSTPALDPECQVVDRYVDDRQQAHEAAVHACAVDGTPPCWSLDDDAKCSAGSKLLHVTRAAGELPDGLTTSLSCATCVAGAARAGCPCVAGQPVAGCLP